MKNSRRSLDERALGELGIYVYGLVDPRSRRVIYVGKGGGQFETERGNLRVFSHFGQTDRELARAANDGSKLSAKCVAIDSVWSRGEDVEVVFYRRRLRDEQEAFHVEAAVIAALAGSPQGDTDNANDGMRVRLHGALSMQQAVDLGAPPIDPPTPCHVLLFNIAKSMSKRSKSLPEDVYECTRFAWAGLRIPAQHVIAVGYAGEISRGAYMAPQWHKESDGRKSFTAERTNWLPEDHPLVGRNLRKVLHLAPWRKRNGVIGVEFDGRGHFRLFRGAPDAVTQRWQSCAEERPAAPEAVVQAQGSIAS